jgi:hypothetical protein
MAGDAAAMATPEVSREEEVGAGVSCGSGLKLAPAYAGGEDYPSSCA